jgi:Zn-dependent alcohol dehydrogenase
MTGVGAVVNTGKVPAGVSGIVGLGGVGQALLGAVWSARASSSRLILVGKTENGARVRSDS